MRARVFVSMKLDYAIQDVKEWDNFCGNADAVGSVKLYNDH